jgi:hypothetical protein
MANGGGEDQKVGVERLDIFIGMYLYGKIDENIACLYSILLEI